MCLSWIDECIAEIIKRSNSNDILDIYSTFNINIIKANKNNLILKGNEALYIRNYFDTEVVFIRDDLQYQYEKFILAHELGHALLHTEIYVAAFNKDLLNKSKLERQANYFALKLLNIELDSTEYEGYTIEQIAQALCVSQKSLFMLLESFKS